MRQNDKETFQKLIGCHPGCVPELILWQFLSISRKLRGALRWDILRNLNGQPKPPEQDIHEETIQRILALMEAYEHAKLAINYRLENWGEPYEPYFDIQYLCDLRYRAHHWNDGNAAAFLGVPATRKTIKQILEGRLPPIGEDAGRVLKKITGELPSSEGTANYRALIVSALNRQAARMPRPGALQKLILSILEDNPRQTWKAVLKELEKRKGQGVIESIKGDLIKWLDSSGKADFTPTGAIKDRVSRAKKILDSR